MMKDVPDNDPFKEFFLAGPLVHLFHVHLPLTRGRVKAWCLRIHTEASHSLSRHLSSCEVQIKLI
jgi:hypothetical protein